MPSKIRLQRISDRMRMELADLLIRKIQDPRLKRIFVTDVRVDRELAFADVYVSAVEGRFWCREIARHDRRRLGYALWTVLAKWLL